MTIKKLLESDVREAVKKARKSGQATHVLCHPLTHTVWRAKRPRRGWRAPGGGPLYREVRVCFVRRPATHVLLEPVRIEMDGAVVRHDFTSRWSEVSITTLERTYRKIS